MPYDVRRRIAKQWSQTPVQEEEDVWKSLKEAGYKFRPFCSPDAEDCPSMLDFAAVRDLYRAYRDWRKIKRKFDEEPDLTIQQFGVAFNAVTDSALVKSRRRVVRNGRSTRVWGYRGVAGPNSYRVRRRLGRPTL